MNSVLRLFIFLGLLSFSGFAQDSVSVTFRVLSPGLKAGEKVFITGGNDKLGNWQPGEVQLSGTDNGSYAVTLTFARHENLEYKFTKGSWQEEAQFSQGVAPGNFRLIAEKDTTVIVTVPFWGGNVTVPHGQITGTVKYHRQVGGTGIPPRDIIVWLPPDYEKNPDRRYPVLYMHDGQNIVDPATCGFGYDWQVDENADSLIRCKVMEPIIVVGIYCTANRTAEYSPGAAGTAYMNYLIDIVKPLIDKTYRTKPDRLNTAVGGSSMGGLISFMLAWEHPEVYAKAICFSPALKIDRFDYAAVVKNTKEKKDIFLYIYNGGVGLEAMLQPGVTSTVDILKEKGYHEGKDFVLTRDITAEHNERAWAKHIGEALVRLFGGQK
jgi:predicted alpha/beta superfamily hydrolase